MTPRAGLGGAPVRAADEWIERVRAASDIVELVGQTVQLRRVGRNWVGLCPFHQEKTPSFTVSADRQLYHCFSCKAGGDVFKFVQESEKVGFLEAAEMLSRRAAIPVPERRGERTGVRNALLEALELATQSYENWLRDPRRGAETRAYLEGRGLNEATVRAFRLGLAPEGWQNLLDRLRGKFTEEVLVQAGLAMARDEGRGHYDRFRNRLMIPLIAPGGHVVGFAARALGEESPKYLNSPETPLYRKSAFVYALEQARRALPSAGELVVVEGQFDAIALHQAGIVNVVATSGTALTAEHARAFQRLIPRVTLTFDGDAAGREATMRSIGVLLAEGLEVCVVDLPSGLDPDGLLRARGREGWNERRAAAYDPVEFVQRHVFRAADASGSTPADARERALGAVVGLAAGVSDPVRVKLLLQRAGEVFGVEEKVLIRAVALRHRGQSIESPLRAVVREQQRGAEGLERQLLQALLHAPEMVEELRPRFAPDDFQNGACRELADWLWSGEEGLPQREPAAGLARELATSGLASTDWAGIGRDAARRLRLRRLRERHHERQRELSRAVGEEQLRLKQEIQEISLELADLSKSNH